MRQRDRVGPVPACQNSQRLGLPITDAVDADQVRELRRSSISKPAVSQRHSIGGTSVRCILAAPHKKKWTCLRHYAALPKAHGAIEAVQDGVVAIHSGGRSTSSGVSGGQES
jgi:hypothetical protein